MKRSKAGQCLKAIGLALGMLAPIMGCSSGPPPSTDKIIELAKTVTGDCHKSKSQECEKTQKDLCEGLSKLIDAHDNDLDPDEAFGGQANNVIRASRSCAGLYVTSK